MKFLKYNSHNIYISLFLISILFVSSCYEYPELSEVQYENYRRVIGPEGGTINFYQNYTNDSIEDILIKMEFPVNALDSFVVFNMYEFNDMFASNDLSNIGMFINTQFLYFIPFYESEGYTEHAPEDNIRYHLSIAYNTAVRITYNLNNYFSNEYTNFEARILSGNSKLYRVKIPKENEWNANIWVNWNLQGYPDGYDNIDLVYLITGRWSQISEWGYGQLSLTNWEEISYTYDETNKSISFFTDNTDYMYVMGERLGK